MAGSRSKAAAAGGEAVGLELAVRPRIKRETASHLGCDHSRVELVN